MRSAVYDIHSFFGKHYIGSVSLTDAQALAYIDYAEELIDSPDNKQVVSLNELRLMANADRFREYNPYMTVYITPINNPWFIRMEANAKL